jgi:hypothetical protein
VSGRLTRCGDLILWFDRGSGRLVCTATAPSGLWAGFPLWLGSGRAWELRIVGPTVSTGPDRLDLDDGDIGALTAGLSGLPGRWAAIAHERATGRWYVFTDRFGSLHLYRSRPEHGSSVDTWIGTVPDRRSEPEIDRAALGALALLGFPIGDRTLDASTRVLPPATCLTLDAAGREVDRRRYWHWSHRVEARRSPEATLGELWDLLRHLVTDGVPEGAAVVLPVSGGLDSRALAAALAGVPDAPAVRAFTYGYDPSSAEIRSAAAVADRAGFPALRLTIPPYLFDRADLIADALDGACDVTQCRQAGVRDELAELAGADRLLLGGHYGDLWLDHTGVGDGDLAVEALRRFVKPGGSEALALFGIDEAGVRAAATDVLRRALDDLGGVEDRDVRLKALKVDTYGHRFTAPGLRMYQTAAFPIVPFGDPRFVDWVTTVPGELLPRRRLEIDLLCRYAPALASVEWDGRGVTPRQYRRSWAVLPRRVVRRVARALPGRHAAPPAIRNWEVQFLGGGLDRTARWIDEDVWPAWADQDAARRLVADLGNAPGDRRLGYALSVLFSTVSWERSRRSGPSGRAVAPLLPELTIAGDEGLHVDAR